MQTADRVRQILSTRGLTLYQVSQRSADIFGHSSPYYIPQRLYHELATGALSPNIHQLVAFSRISNYRLSDWLAIFGFRLDDYSDDSVAHPVEADSPPRLVHLRRGAVDSLVCRQALRIRRAQQSRL